MTHKKIPLEKASIWYRTAKQHWITYRPKAVKALRESGTLEEELMAAAKEAEEMFNLLVKRGMNPYQAQNMAERDFLILPDYDEG